MVSAIMPFEKPKSVNFAVKPLTPHRRSEAFLFQPNVKFRRGIIKLCQPKRQLHFWNADPRMLKSANYVRFLRDKTTNFHEDFQAKAFLSTRYFGG